MTVHAQKPPSTVDVVTPSVDGETFPRPECRICHCTEESACPAGCWWVDDPIALGQLCSRCVTLALALDELDAAINGAGKPLTARELANRSDIRFQELIGVATADSPSLLDELVACGHLDRTVHGPHRAATYQLPQAAV